MLELSKNKAILRFFRPPMECARTALNLETLNTDTELMNRHIQLRAKWANLKYGVIWKVSSHSTKNDRLIIHHSQDQCTTIPCMSKLW